jgi:hypothetical protein
MKPFIAALALTAVLLSACDHTTQTTSGEAYLSQYKSVPVTGPARITRADDGTVIEEVKSIDQRIREAAAVEPVLRFPARIGLARIDRGSLTTIPMEEADGWSKAAARLGKSFGEFVPVNPMVANLVSGSDYSGSYHRNLTDIVNTIRLGAARQHLDAVLIYEVVAEESEHSNILSAANVTVLGGYVLPSKRHDAAGLGNALLIDVVQAYPYGTLTATVDKKSRTSSAWGWGSTSGDREAFVQKVKAQAALQLADESYDLFNDLRGQLGQRGPLKLTKN